MARVMEFSPDMLPSFNVSEAARYAGVRGDGESLEKLPRLKAQLDGVLTPRACYDVYSVKVEGEAIDFGSFSVRSHSLARCLEKCRSAAVFAATAGHGVDRLIRARMLTLPSEGCLLGAIGSERVEALCDLVCSHLADTAELKGKIMRPRFSPGYGDLSLELQREIFSLLDCTRSIGISLGEGLLMTPEKSVTAIVGFEDAEYEEK